MLQACGFHLVPGPRVYERASRHSPATIADIERALVVSLVVAQQNGALKHMVMMLEPGGKVMFVEDWQPGVPAGNRTAPSEWSIGGIKRHVINGEVKRESGVGLHLCIKPLRLLRAVARQVPAIEQIDDEVLSKLARVIASLLILGKVTEIKKRVRKRMSNSTADLVV